MKKAIAVMVYLALSAAAVQAEAGLSIKIRGGYTRIGYSDFNKWIDDTNAQIPSGSPTLDNLNWIPEVAAELAFPIHWTLSGSVGVGYLSGKSDYSVIMGGDSFSFKHTVSSIPVIFNVHWEPPLVFINPFAYGGIGLYKTDVEFDYWLETGGNREGYNSTLDKWGFGLQGGGGVRIAVMPAVSFDVGIQARWTDIDGFEGTATNQDGDTKDVYLASYTSGGTTYFGPEEKGSGKPEGSVELSGFTIFIGMTIGF